MPTQREKIIKQALEILENRPNGIRYSELFKEIKSKLPDVPENTIHGTIWNLDKKIVGIAKPERGIFILKKFIKEGLEIKIKEIEKTAKAIDETLFYKSFAEYLEEAEKDVGRIESLCSRFSLGLILFDKNNPQNPNFEIRTRASKSEPDYFYVNEYLGRLGENSKKLF